MRWILRVLTAIVVIGLVLLGIGFMLPSAYHVERSVVVKAPPERLYPLVAAPKRWKEWSAWNRRDPAMKIDYFGPDLGAGSGWSWDSKSEGKGRMTLTQADPASGFHYTLYFPDFDSTSQGDFRFEVVPEGTRITWNNDGDMGSNPMHRYIGLLMDRLAGADFATGLANLKALAESQP